MLTFNIEILTIALLMFLKNVASCLSLDNCFHVIALLALIADLCFNIMVSVQ